MDSAGMPDNPNLPGFWEYRYEHGRDGWDIGQPAPAFIDYLAGDGAPEPGAMLALGSGRGHDAILFAQHGFGVVGVDFAPSAVRDARQAARRAGLMIDFHEHDIFTLPSSFDGRFKYVLEHTCFSAISPARRPEYAALVARLLEPGGLYIALFFTHGHPGGPPFDVTAGEIRTLFSPYLVVEKLEPPRRSVPQRQGMEHFALMRSRGALPIREE